MFKEYNQNQTFLLPPNFKDFLGEGHEAIILSELIDELNLKKLYKEYKIEGNGRPAYNPRMLLKVLFYGYMNQTFSSRKLASKLKTDLGFMYVAGNNQPDFRTINRFRKEKGKILEDIFIQIVLKAKELGMIKFGTVSLDGTKIYANASKTKNYKIEDLDKKIKKLFEEADKIDEIEDKELGKEKESNIPEELKTKKGRDKKRKEIKEKKKKLESRKREIEKEIKKKKEVGIKQDRINMTDKDSRLMMMKRKDRGNGYNPQNLTENQFILMTSTSNSAEDRGELKPILERFKETYNTVPKNQLADKGYASEENYEYLEKENINSYIPHQENKVKIEDYIYDEEKDTYKDEKGNIYKFKQNVGKEKGGKRGRPKGNKKLKEEEIKSKIYVRNLEDGSKKFLCISKNRQELCKRNDDRLYSKVGKEIYKKRSGCVENVFGNIKKNLGFERFLLRGFEGVQIEWNLICLAHNLKKIMNF